MGTRALLLPFVASPGREMLAQGQSTGWAALAVGAERGGVRLDKDINGSETRCDPGRATSLLALLRAGTELSPVQCPRQQGLTLGSVCVTAMATAWCPQREQSAPKYSQGSL